jgi:hypothetical protein
MVVPRTKSNIMIPIIIRYCEWTASFSAVVVKKKLTFLAFFVAVVVFPVVEG